MFRVLALVPHPRYRVCQSSSVYYYENIQNVVARVRGMTTESAVMVSTHYDSVPYSPGASDNGAAVAVALEVMTNLLDLQQQNAQVLDTSIVFLFDDGEEAGLLGAHAFMRHPWYNTVRTYINLG